MNEIILSQDNALSLQSERLICETISKLKELQDAEKSLKEELVEEMKRRGLVKIDTAKLTITYVGETQAEKFDKKKFREENPDLYDKYCSFSSVKDYVKVAIK